MPVLDSSARRARRGGWWGRLPQVLALLALAACVSVEDKRVRELLHERGFGTRAQGVAPTENYVAGGDILQILIDPIAQLTPGAEMLSLLAVPQPIAIDGTMLVPYIGPIYVLGLTEAQVAALISEQLGRTFTFPVKLHARIVGAGKALYMFGETARGRIPFAKPDLTLMELMATIGWTPLANLGRVRITRPDAQNPLQLEVNLREMIDTGNMTYNIRLQENDFIYVPPTFFGALTRFLQKLLEPLRVIVASLFGIASLEITYDVLMNRGAYRGGGFFF